MRIYLSSNWQSQRRMRQMRERLEAEGFEICSSWLDEDPAQRVEHLSLGERIEYAIRDMREVASADLLILDTLEPSLSGGREVECGAALGSGKLVWIVGPVRNIFHELADRHFVSWDHVPMALHDLRRFLEVENGD
jgi:hypothetical protein